MITNTSWKRRPTTLFYQTSSSLVACLLEGKQLAYSSSNLHSQVMNFYWKIDALFQGISTWNSLVCKYLFFCSLTTQKVTNSIPQNGFSSEVAKKACKINRGVFVIWRDLERQEARRQWFSTLYSKRMLNDHTLMRMIWHNGEHAICL